MVRVIGNSNSISGMENPYDSPRISEPPHLASRSRFSIRLHHAIAVAWFAVPLTCSIYLSQVQHLPPQYRVYWPVGIELLGVLVTMLVVTPAFVVRVVYL